MTIEVNPDWWKTLFDEVYLVTDARSVDDRTITRQEINLFMTLIPLKPEQRILDLCGGHGRHAHELCRRGFRSCTVLDYSQSLIDIGLQNAADMGDAIRFVQGDARETNLLAESFDHVLILGNSLGYIDDPDADLRILQESRRLLKPGGWLLLDVTNGQAVKSTLSPCAWHEIGEDVVVCRQREVINGRITARELVLRKSKGLVRDNTYAIRLYEADQLAALVARAGFSRIQAHTDAAVLDGTKDLGCMNQRLVIVARKSSKGEDAPETSPHT